MKIWQVVPYYPPHVGGMEYYVERLSEELAARGHDVTVFTSSNNGKQETYTKNKVKIKTLKIMTKIYNNPISPTLFTQLLTEEKPDIINTHQYPIFYSDLAAFASLTRRIPLMVHIHVISDAKSSVSGLTSDIYYSTLGLRTLTLADVVVVPSNVYRTKLSKMYVNPNKLQVVYYGIDIKKFNNNSSSDSFKAKYCLKNSIVILSVGRLNYQKGLRFLIKAMSILKKSTPNIKLVIVGEGEELPILKRLVHSLGIAESVVFTGALNQTEIKSAYSSCDIFVLPSLFESFGISLIEAQASGKPVIGTKAGGAPEALLNGETGYLVEPGNSFALAEKIAHILSNHSKAIQMGIKGKKFVEQRFSIKNSVTKIEEIYEKIIH